MEQTFRASVEHATGVTILENGVSSEIITLDPLYLESDATIPYLLPSTSVAPMITSLSEDTDYSGYHVMTVAELEAIKSTCCEVREESDPSIAPLAYLAWKDPADIPGGLTGVEWVKQTLGVQFDGLKRISTSEDGSEVVTVEGEGVGANSMFWLGDSVPDPYNSSIKVASFSVPGGINASTVWGPGISTIMRGIILVKNRS